MGGKEWTKLTYYCVVNHNVGYEGRGSAGMSEDCLTEMIDSEQRAQMNRIREQADAGSRLGLALEELESAPCSVSSLVELAPRLICELGFDRAIISHVEAGMWVSESVFIVKDEQWAHDINRIGREQPQPLVAGLFETEVVRRREAVVVTGVQQESRVHRAIADASLSRSYAAAPILSGGRVIGLLHADRYRQTRDVDEYDRQLLVSFSHGLRIALSRAQLAEQLQSAEEDLSVLNRALARASAGDHLLRLKSVDESIAPSVPLPRENSRSLPAELTNRERQVLELMAEGRTNNAIGRELVIADGTVKQHVKHILRKLNAGNRSEVIAIWFQAAADKR